MWDDDKAEALCGALKQVIAAKKNGLSGYTPACNLRSNTTQKIRNVQIDGCMCNSHEGAWKLRTGHQLPWEPRLRKIMACS